MMQVQNAGGSVAKTVELMGGPTPGWQDIADDAVEHVLIRPDMKRIRAEAMTARDEDMIPTKTGRYKQRYSGSRVFDWVGWDE